MSDFLLELRSEEIPARMQDKAAADLVRLFEAELHKSDLFVGKVEAFVTPRRLAILARDLPHETEALSEEIKGPRSSAPEQAIEGFLRKNGLARSGLVEQNGVLFARIEKPGRPMIDVLADAIPAIVRAFPWPKAMRWGAASLSPESPRWVRPLQGVVALFGDAVIPVDVAGVASGRETAGHRFLHTGRVTIADASSYAGTLRAAQVIVDAGERRTLVRDGARAAARAAGLVLVEDEGLVAENAGLTEWPVPLLGRFDPAFLDVPREVIQLTMRTNQKYFACVGADGALAPAFVCTANIAASDGGAAIVAGNAKVLAARLSDARFFWEQDRKVPLAVQAERLKGIVFHEKLGTVADKAERVARLARWLAEEGIVKPSPLQGRGLGEGPATGGALADRPLSPALSPEGEREQLATLAEQAARLCKADLVTGMVGEFPELQGVMGGYYARAEGLPPEVADAIRDHYKPVGQGDDVPTAPVTVAVSLADKLDTIAKFFDLGEVPTGSRDPFALRRAALAIIQLIVNNHIRASLGRLLGRAVMPEVVLEGWPAGSLLLAFFADRLKVQQREAGVRHDLIDAVFALGGEDDLVRLLARVTALQAFVETADGANLLAGYRRAANILRAEAKKDQAATPDRHPELVSGSRSPQTGTLVEAWMLKRVQHDGEGGDGTAAAFTFAYTPDPAEQALAETLDAQLPLAEAAVAAEQFAAAMTALSVIRPAIDRFFDDVTVNDSVPVRRTTRLALLDKFVIAMHKIADFSKIEG